MSTFRFGKANKTLIERRMKITSKKRELSRIKKGLDAADTRAERIEYRRRKKEIQQEIFKLWKEVNAAKFHADEPQTGALPDFVIIGAKKCGTTFLYHLLTQHPHVEPAAAKELHYFNRFFGEEDTEWYRHNFPVPKWKDGRKTITGEATPEYLSFPPAPERMAQVVPGARLIALLRNPVDRTYSDYQMVMRKDRETRSFEEALGITNARSERRGETQLPGEGGESYEGSISLDNARRKYLSKSIYVDQLLRWWEFFDKEQTLVLKSEDFSENPRDNLKTVFRFLDLPDWEPEARNLHNKRNKGGYGGGMNPATRLRLEEFFEAHNRRLYEHLGVDFGW